MALSRHTVDFIHFILSMILALVVPPMIYWGFDAIGLDITGVMYMIVWAMLLTTAFLIITETIVAWRHPGAPERDETKPEPKASAIICAYMPNEQHTIMETINHFLSLEYAGEELQIILSCKFCHIGKSAHSPVILSTLTRIPVTFFHLQTTPLSIVQWRPSCATLLKSTLTLSF